MDRDLGSKRDVPVRFSSTSPTCYTAEGYERKSSIRRLNTDRRLAVGNGPTGGTDAFDSSVFAAIRSDPVDFA